jgi:hypothetical protein
MRQVRQGLQLQFAANLSEERWSQPVHGQYAYILSIIQKCKYCTVVCLQTCLIYYYTVHRKQKLYIILTRNHRMSVKVIFYIKLWKRLLSIKHFNDKLLNCLFT